MGGLGRGTDFRSLLKIAVWGSWKVLGGLGGCWGSWELVLGGLDFSVTFFIAILGVFGGCWGLQRGPREGPRGQLNST